MDKENNKTENFIFVIYSTFPEKIGGRETWIDGIAKKLAERGHTITIYSLKSSFVEEIHYDFNNYKNIQIFKVPTMISFPYSRWFILRSRFKYLHIINMILFSALVSIQVLTNHKKDQVIVLQKLGIEALASYLPKSKKRKIIAFTHGDLMYETRKQFPNSLAVWLMETTEKYTANRVDLIFFTNQNEMKNYLDRLKINRNKCVVLYNGIDKNNFNSLSPEIKIEVKKKLHIKESEKVFVNVATIHEIKGHIYLIKAIAKIPQEHRKELKFLFVGAGSPNNLLDIAKKLNIDHNIMFIGQLRNSEVIKILKSSDIFIMPSLMEGLPISMLEAMCCGLPVIASNIGGIPEIVMDNGILVPPKNSEKLKDAIVTMLEKFEFYSDKASNAKERIIKKHNWENITDQFMTKIKEL
jgi:glycosyltransferase involved in cell wall biosynthesis